MVVSSSQETRSRSIPRSATLWMVAQEKAGASAAFISGIVAAQQCRNTSLARVLVSLAGIGHPD